MINTTQAAALLGVSVQYLRRMAEAGRVQGAFRIGEGRTMWIFPDNPSIDVPERELARYKAIVKAARKK